MSNSCLTQRNVALFQVMWYHDEFICKIFYSNLSHTRNILVHCQSNLSLPYAQYSFFPQPYRSHLTMHLIITNIPEDLHTSDLRNFFSEYVETEAFICFHFRHRPQKQLLQILALSGLDKTANQDNSPKAVHSGHEADMSEHDVQQREEKDKCIPSTVSEPKYDIFKGNTQESSARSSEGSSCLDGGTPKTHWLSTGLSGLTSIINEKKQKARTSLRTGLKTFYKEGNSDSMTKKNKSSVDQNSEVKDCHEIAKVLVSSPESDKRTCCVVDIKNEYSEGFIKKYHKKHWLNKAGDILVPKCFILKVHFSSTTGNSMCSFVLFIL